MDRRLGRIVSVFGVLLWAGCGRTPLQGVGAEGDGPGTGGRTGADSSAGGTAGSGGAVGADEALIVLPGSARVPVGRSVQFAGYLRVGGVSTDISSQVDWSADNAAVATISAPGGQLRALAPGQATVHAAFQRRMAAATVEVTAATITRLVVTPMVVMLNVGGMRTLQAVATYSDGRQIDVSQQGIWRSLDEGTVKVSNLPGSRGQVTLVAASKAQVAVAFAGAEGTAVVAVTTAVTLVSVAVTPSNPTVMVGGPPGDLALVGSYSDGSTRNLSAGATWTSMNRTVAQVMGGRVVCNGPGSTTITAAAMGQTATTTVTCASVPVVGVYLVPGNTTLPPGTRVQFAAWARLAMGTDREVTTMAMWSSDNPGVATVMDGGQQRGVVTTGMPGKATISAVYQGMTAQASVAVGP
jgi:hypothetical protein